MKRASRSETALIERLTAVLATGGTGRAVRVGIGDDAAVLRAVRAPLVWTVDTSVEGVHFEHRWLTPEDIGARSFHAAVSDLAAMGARPLAALSSLVVPPSFDERRLLALAAGQASAARELRCPVAGGNLSRGRELSVTTTVLGTAARPLTRAGALPGDDVWLVGDVGLAAAGLACLQRRRELGSVGRATRAALDVCIVAWRRPRALVREGRRLVGRAHAAIDVSDGVATDAAHLSVQSDVRLLLDEARLVRALRPELVVASTALGVAPLSFALSGGEDYALIATGPPRARPARARLIGGVEAGSGVALLSRDGTLRELPPSGFDHLRKKRG